MSGGAHEEIERKFLIGSLPAPELRGRPVRIDQGYLAIGADGTEVRIRRSGTRCTLTVKSGGGMTRRELETEITIEQFQSLWPATSGRRVEKDRYLVPLGDVTVELDVFRGALDGLVVAEVEFPSPDAGKSFAAPEWFAKEVTDDPRYLNRNLAIEGRPDPVTHHE